MKNREEIQLEMKTIVIDSLESHNKAVVQASVGLGKTRLCLETLAHYNPDKITWLTNSEELRDSDTPAEFIKWGYEYLLEKTTIMCYQTACRLENQDLGFVIGDEFDFALTEQYVKGITNNYIDKFLGVSGTYTEEKLEILNKLGLPLVYKVTTNEVQDLQILNKTKVIFVEYELDLAKTRKTNPKYPTWRTSENEQYSYWEGQYISTMIQYAPIQKEFSLLFDVLRENKGKTYSKLIYSFLQEYKQKEIIPFQRKLAYISSNRAKLLHTLDSSKRIARQLSDRILKESNDNKVLIFSTLTEHLDSFVPNTVHSKNKKGNTVFDDFNEGKIREAGCISIADRGKNFVGLNYGIFESYDGSETKGLQRLGRFCRLLEGESTIYVLVPYYRNKQNKLLPTRSAGWAISMFSNYVLDESNSLTINFKDL